MQPKFTIGTIIRPGNSFRFYKIKSIGPGYYSDQLHYRCIKCTIRGKEFYKRKTFTVQQIDSTCTALGVVPEEIKAVYSRAGALKRRRTHLQSVINAAKVEIDKIEEELLHLKANEVPRNNLQHVSKDLTNQTR